MPSNTEKLTRIEFSADEGDFYIECHSTAELIVNGHSLAVGERVRLQHGDNICIAGMACTWSIANAVSPPQANLFSVRWLRSNFLDDGRNTQFVPRNRLTGRESPPKKPCPQEPHLHIFPGKPEETAVALKPHTEENLIKGPTLWRVGSGADCAIKINMPGVSSLHACIEFDNGRWRVVDQLARNGVLVNGHASLISYLTFGDRIQIGPAECVFHIPKASPAPTRSKRRELIAAAIGVLVAVVLAVIIIRARRM